MALIIAGARSDCALAYLDAGLQLSDGSKTHKLQLPPNVRHAGAVDQRDLAAERYRTCQMNVRGRGVGFISAPALHRHNIIKL
jgi:hypothetical protein